MYCDGIVVIARQSSNLTKIKEMIPTAEIVYSDLSDKESLSEIMHDSDTLLHIAGIHWSREVVAAAADAKVRRLILVHTTGIYSKYKAAGEEYRQIDEFVYETCKKNKIMLTILRPTMIYGSIKDKNVATFIKMVDKLPLMPIVNGARYELQPVHYDDLGKAYYEVLINEDITANKDYILSGEKPIYLRDMLKEIGKNLNKKVRFISCPFVVAYTGAWLIFIFSLFKIDYREKVQRLCEPRVYSHEQARNDFGFNPRSFEVGIVDEVKEYLKSKKRGI